jgi:hypothetical protein
VSQFNQLVVTLRTPVTLDLSNTISVRFGGVPESEIMIAIATE